MYTLQGHRGPVSTCNFDESGDFLVSGSEDKQIMLWKTNFEKVNLCSELDETQQIDNGIAPHEVTVMVSDDDDDDDNLNTKSQHQDGNTFTPINNTAPQKHEIEDNEIKKTLKEMKTSLDHTLAQVNTLTQTIILLEQRLSLAENKLVEVSSQCNK